jgi:hypothetical protein
MVAKTRRAVKRNRKQTKKRSRRGGAPPTLTRNKTPSQAFAQKKRMAREREMRAREREMRARKQEREREMRAKIAELTAAVKQLRISNSKIPGFDKTADFLEKNPEVKTTAALNALISPKNILPGEIPPAEIPPALLNTPLQMIVSIGVAGSPFQFDIRDVMIRGPHSDGPVYSVDPYAALFFMVWLADYGLKDRESMPYELETSDELFEFKYDDERSNSHVDIVLRPMPGTPGERMPEESLAGRMRALTMNEGFPDDASANPFSPAEFRAATQTPRIATKSQKPSLTAAAAPVSASVGQRKKTKKGPRTKKVTRTRDEIVADAEKNQTRGAKREHLQAALVNLIKKWGDGLKLEHQAGIFPHSVEQLKNTAENGKNAQIKDRITKIVKRLDARLEEIKKKSSN